MSLLAAGCVGPTRTRGRVVSGALATFGTVLIIDGFVGPCEVNDFGDAVKCGLEEDIGPYYGGGLVLASALLLAYNELRTLPSEAPAEAPPPPPLTVVREPIPEPPTHDPVLRQLTQQASYAARDRRCGAVAVIARRVNDLDPTYRHGAFLTDDSIGACL